MNIEWKIYIHFCSMCTFLDITEYELSFESQPHHTLADVTSANAKPNIHECAPQWHCETQSSLWRYTNCLVRYNDPLPTKNDLGPGQPQKITSEAHFFPLQGTLPWPFPWFLGYQVRVRPHDSTTVQMRIKVWCCAGSSAHLLKKSLAGLTFWVFIICQDSVMEN